MRVLLLGANGYLGPHVVSELETDHDLVVTDVVDIDTPHESHRVDVGKIDQVRAAAIGCDIIVNCSVSRRDRKGAFDVNTLGTYNALTVATELGNRRFINTGPRFTMAGPSYLTWDFGIPEHIPPHPGTLLYALSKSVGYEICRIFARQHDVHVLSLVFSSFIDPAPPPGWRGTMNPFAVTYADAARAVRCALHADTARLPSRFEAFFVTVDLPQDQCRAGKARRLLGWEPQDDLRGWFSQPQSRPIRSVASDAQ